MSTREGVLGRIKSVVGSTVDAPARPFVLGAIAVSIVTLVGIPLLFFLWTSVWSGFPGQFSAEFTLENFEVVYFGDFFDVSALFSNSLIIAVGMTLTGLTFGLTFAWLFVRTNLPTKGWMELALLSGQAVPGYIYAIMYVTTYNPQNGLVSTYLKETFGVGVPLDIFSPWGIAFVVGINVVSTFYLLIVPALQDMDPALEEVGRIHGANVLTTLRGITLPLIKPAILSGVIVIFLYGLGEFAMVALLGARRGFDVYSTAIWRAIGSRFPPAYGEPAALACSLLALMFVLVWYYRTITSRKEDYMTLTGQRSRGRTWDLGQWRWPLAVTLWIILAVVWIMPMLVMVAASLHATWAGSIDLSALTLTHYADAVANGPLRQAFTNSVIVAVGGATLGTILVVGLSYYTERTKARFRGVVDFLSLTPLAVPGVIMGASVLFTFLWIGKIHPLLNLYGTLAIIIVGCVIVFIPVTSRIAIGNVVQIHDELEEAARIAGASWLQQMRSIFLPLFRNTTIVIWFFLAIHIFQLLSIPIMVYTSDTVVVPIKLFELYLYEPSLGPVSAISAIFIGLTLLVLVGLRYLGVTFYELGQR